MPSDKVFEFRLSTLEGVVGEIKTAVKSIDGSLKMLASLEASHAQTREALSRAFSDIDDHEARLRRAEADLPTMRLVRNWVVAGVIGCVAMVGAAVVGMVIVNAGLPPAYSANARPG